MAPKGKKPLLSASETEPPLVGEDQIHKARRSKEIGTLAREEKSEDSEERAEWKPRLRARSKPWPRPRSRSKLKAKLKSSKRGPEHNRTDSDSGLDSEAQARKRRQRLRKMGSLKGGGR